MKPRPSPHARARKIAGFSLVEVTLALGIVAFSLVAIVGLLASGLQNGRESIAEVKAADLAAAIISQRRAAPTVVNNDFALPPLDVASTDVVYLKEDGTIASSPADRHYRMDYTLSRPPGDRLATLHLSLVTPWQAIPADNVSNVKTDAVVQTRFETISFFALQP